MSKNKPIASLSLDLDNQWSYMKTHGDEGWDSFPSYLDIVVPRVLDLLKEHGLTITFFIVGQDAALEKNHQAIRAIAEAGHEISNHSFNHEPWLHLYTEEEIEAELGKTADHLRQVTGKTPIGFRGPGYSLSPAVLRVLKRNGYQYDCSTLPTFIGPLARTYYFLTAKLNDEEMESRKRLFGTLKEGLRPLKPYRWQPEDMLEIPVTTMPIFRIPFHVSYLLYLAGFSPALARFYFRVAIFLCRLTGTHPSLLLHPLDFLGGDDIEELAFFPAMNMPGEQKVKLAGEILDIYAKNFTVVPMHKHAEAIAQKDNLKTMQLRL